MSHHTGIHHDDDRAVDDESRRLVWIAVLYVATAVFALMISELADVGVVISVVAGFVLAALLTGVAHRYLG